MPSINTSGKVGYMYDQTTDTFHALTGVANTAANYSWSGSHSFSSPVSFNDVLTMRAGYNNFQNPAARDAAITSPSNGIVCFVRQDASGTTINQIQAYSGGKWIDISTNHGLITVSSPYTLALADAGKIILCSFASQTNVTIPLDSSASFNVGQEIELYQTGAGKINFTPASGVTLNSLNSYRKTSGIYAHAKLLKVATNTWLLSGDINS